MRAVQSNQGPSFSKSWFFMRIQGRYLEMLRTMLWNRLTIYYLFFPQFYIWNLSKMEKKGKASTLKTCIPSHLGLRSINIYYIYFSSLSLSLYKYVDNHFKNNLQMLWNFHSKCFGMHLLQILYSLTKLEHFLLVCICISKK